MTLRWFLSRSVRHAIEMHKHVRKLLNAQRDILPPQAIESVTASLLETRQAIDSKADKETLKKRIEDLEKTANKWLKPYPHPDWRENIEVLLVAIAVAMAIRTFFLQPFKIPTGSMQPTLYGVTADNLRDNPSAKIPRGFGKFADAVVHGTFYHTLRAEADGQLVHIGPPEQFMRFINKHRLTMRYYEGGREYVKTHTLWFSPDERFSNWANLQQGQFFRKGDFIVKLKEVTGDHLFVDRLTYNFRRPNRGEIVVFQTKGIIAPNMRQDQYYIKRLVALGGERVRIGDDRHVRINGERLDASTARFENIYTFTGPPDDSRYSGHINGSGPVYAPLFPDENTEYTVPKDQFFVLGDNTVNSYDSRGWGGFSQENVIGKAYFVYWPISNRGSSRFGWGYR